MYHPPIPGHLRIRYLARQAASQSSQSLYPSLFRRGLINQANLASQQTPIPNNMATSNDAIINTNVSACGPHEDQPGNLSNVSTSIEHIADTAVDHLDTTQAPIDKLANNDGIDDQVRNLSDASTVAEHASDAEANHLDTTQATINKLANNDGINDQPGNFSDASTSVEQAEQTEQAEQAEHTEYSPYASTYYSDSDSDNDPSEEISWISGQGQGIWVHNFTHVRQFEAEKLNADLNGGGKENFSAEMIKDEEEENVS
ncbi:hypothetical protein BOTCAL_0269g00140 [Botryotinia calthae]|uniref:Uncharacterized protein n=1 Tax=Botryotinia calthae TaxID=38488 RepID=A0A4Y8CVR3_9HELO|nr:hypothetical protein BOTCAL_0269g00140 [Botryotinia calthae]